MIELEDADHDEWRAVGVASVPGALSVPRRPPPVRPIPSPPTELFGLIVGRAAPIVGAAQRDDPEPPHGVGGPAGPDQGASPTMLSSGTAGPAVLLEEAPPVRAPAPDTPSGETAKSGDEPDDPVRKKDLGRRAALPALAAALAAFVVGTSYVALSTRTETPEVDPDLGRWAATAQVVEGAGNGGRPVGDPFGRASLAASGLPTRVRVKAIGLDSPLETLHVAKGALQPPKRFDRAGWYAEGTVPGDVGPAVIAGHVDTKAGPAIFYRLRELAPGDKIDVLRGGKTVTFTVIRTAWYPKKAFPTEEVYGPTPDRQLRLITCGGVFDHRLRSYHDNLVVYAVAG